MAATTYSTPTSTPQRAATRPYNATLSRDLENIDIALSEDTPSRFERIWLKFSKRVLESRIPDMGVRR